MEGGAAPEWDRLEGSTTFVRGQLMAAAAMAGAIAFHQSNALYFDPNDNAYPSVIRALLVPAPTSQPVAGVWY